MLPRFVLTSWLIKTFDFLTYCGYNCYFFTFSFFYKYWNLHVEDQVNKVNKVAYFSTYTQRPFINKLTIWLATLGWYHFCPESACVEKCWKHKPRIEVKLSWTAYVKLETCWTSVMLKQLAVLALSTLMLVPFLISTDRNPINFAVELSTRSWKIVSSKNCIFSSSHSFPSLSNTLFPRAGNCRTHFLSGKSPRVTVATLKLSTCACFRIIFVTCANKSTRSILNVCELAKTTT